MLDCKRACRLDVWTGSDARSCYFIRRRGAAVYVERSGPGCNLLYFVNGYLNQESSIGRLNQATRVLERYSISETPYLPKGLLFYLVQWARAPWNEGSWFLNTAGGIGVIITVLLVDGKLARSKALDQPV